LEVMSKMKGLIKRLVGRENVPIAEAVERGNLKVRKRDVLRYYDSKKNDFLNDPLPKNRQRWEEFARHKEKFYIVERDGKKVEFGRRGKEETLIVQSPGAVIYFPDRYDGRYGGDRVHWYQTPFELVVFRETQHKEYGDILLGKQNEFDYDVEVIARVPGGKSKEYLFNRGVHQGTRQIGSVTFMAGASYTLSRDKIPPEILAEHSHVVFAAMEISGRPDLGKILEWGGE
jgi:hypothetical protein